MILEANEKFSLCTASPQCVPPCETIIVEHEVGNSVSHSNYLLVRVDSRVALSVLSVLLLGIYCVLQNREQFVFNSLNSHWAAVGGFWETLTMSPFPPAEVGSSAAGS